MKISNWLTLVAILVALFGERIWRYFDTKKKKAEARVIIKQNLEQLKSDLLRIRDVRNAGKKNDTDNIIFNSTSFSEVNGYSFLFSDLLLPNMEQLELSKYPATIEFFNHYKINIETIRKREEDSVGTGVLTLGTVNNLISRLENAIGEFSRTLGMCLCVKEIKKIIAREGLVLLGIALVAAILAATEPLAISFDYFFYFLPLCIAYVIIRFIFVSIIRFNLKISQFDKSGIFVSVVFLLSLYFREKVNYIAKPYPKIIEATIVTVFLYTSIFAFILLIRFIIWSVRTLREQE